MFKTWKDLQEKVLLKQKVISFQETNGQAWTAFSRHQCVCCEIRWWCPIQGLSQDFKNVCPKQQFPNICPSRLSYLSTKLTILPATFNCLVCQKGQFPLQSCPRRCFVRIIFGYYTPKVKIKNHHRNLCQFKQEVFRKLPVQKTGRTGPG